VTRIWQTTPATRTATRPARRTGREEFGAEELLLGIGQAIQCFVNLLTCHSPRPAPSAKENRPAAQVS
jgi:hypothetical protein